MHNAYFQFSEPKNEPVLNYAPGSAERKALQQAIAELKNQLRDIPMFINGEEVRSGDKKEIRPPHEKSHLLGFGEIDDISNAAVYLLSSASRWITGVDLVIDGGYVVKK